MERFVQLKSYLMDGMLLLVTWTHKSILGFFIVTNYGEFMEDVRATISVLISLVLLFVAIKRYKRIGLRLNDKVNKK